MSPIHFPGRIETNRLLIRPWVPEDAPALTEAVAESRERLQVFLPWVAFYDDPNAAENFIARANRDWNAGYELPLGIFERSTGRLVGGGGFHGREPTESGWRILEIGYWLRDGEEGKGYMREVVRAQMRLAYELGIERLQLLCDSRNQRSAAVAEACGFRLEALMRCDARDHHGDLRTSHHYGLTRDELAGVIDAWADEPFRLEWSLPPFDPPVAPESEPAPEERLSNPPVIVTELLQLDPADLPEPGVHFTMLDRREARPLGIASLRDRKREVPSFAIDWRFRNEDEPIEFGIELVLALLKLAFEEYNAERVELRIPESAEKHRLIADVTGFEKEGVLRRHRSPITGEIADHVIYSVIKADL